MKVRLVAQSPTLTSQRNTPMEKSIQIVNIEEQKPSKVYRNVSIAVFTLVVLVLGWVFIFTDSSATTPDTAFVSNVVKLTNQDRKEAGLTELTVNKKLSDAAYAKAQDMIKNNYFAHVSPSGKTPWSWMEAQKYNYIYAGENLAINFKTPQDTETAWMNSPSHRKNILSENYKEIGVAEVSGVINGQQSVIVVEMFGTEVSY